MKKVLNFNKNMHNSPTFQMLKLQKGKPSLVKYQEFAYNAWWSMYNTFFEVPSLILPTIFHGLPNRKNFKRRTLVQMKEPKYRACLVKYQ